MALASAYKEEGVPVPPVSTEDNSACVQLVEAKPNGNARRVEKTDVPLLGSPRSSPPPRPSSEDGFALRGGCSPRPGGAMEPACLPSGATKLTAMRQPLQSHAYVCMCMFHVVRPPAAGLVWLLEEECNLPTNPTDASFVARCFGALAC